MRTPITIRTYRADSATRLDGVARIGIDGSGSPVNPGPILQYGRTWAIIPSVLLTCGVVGSLVGAIHGLFLLRIVSDTSLGGSAA